MTITKDLAEALRELIALKDLKEGAMERSIKASMSKGANPSERYHEWNADYKRRKPLAWEAARAAIASHDAAQSAGEAQAVPALGCPACGDHAAHKVQRLECNSCRTVLYTGEWEREPSVPIEQLLKDYAAECSDFSGQGGYEFALTLARRYAERGPNSQMRCVVHTLLANMGAAPPSPAVERDERAAFEAWAGDAYVFTNPETITRDKTRTSYFYGPIKYAWSAWQARAALEGEKP